jgi:C-terminal processing protease CtpA/Prc
MTTATATETKTRKPRASKAEAFAKKATKLLQKAVEALDGLAELTQTYTPRQDQADVILNAVNTSFSEFQDAYTATETEETETEEVSVPV